MKKHKEGKKAGIRVCCNMCGRELKAEGNILMEDCIHVSKEWGYFSDYDLEIHQFNICEPCYNQMVGQFKLPVNKSRMKEVL